MFGIVFEDDIIGVDMDVSPASLGGGTGASVSGNTEAIRASSGEAITVEHQQLTAPVQNYISGCNFINTRFIKASDLSVGQKIPRPKGQAQVFTPS